MTLIVNLETVSHKGYSQSATTNNPKFHSLNLIVIIISTIVRITTYFARTVLFRVWNHSNTLQNEESQTCREMEAGSVPWVPMGTTVFCISFEWMHRAGALVTYMYLHYWVEDSGQI